MLTMSMRKRVVSFSACRCAQIVLVLQKGSLGVVAYTPWLLFSLWACPSLPQSLWFAVPLFLGVLFFGVLNYGLPHLHEVFNILKMYVPGAAFLSAVYFIQAWKVRASQCGRALYRWAHGRKGTSRTARTAGELGIYLRRIVREHTFKQSSDQSLEHIFVSQFTAKDLLFHLLFYIVLWAMLVDISISFWNFRSKLRNWWKRSSESFTGFVTRPRTGSCNTPSYSVGGVSCVIGIPCVCLLRWQMYFQCYRQTTTGN